MKFVGERAIEEGLSGCGLNSSQIDTLVNNSEGVFTFESFAAHWKRLYRGGTYSLGMFNVNYRLAREGLALRHFSELNQIVFGPNGMETTDELMTKTSERNYSVVFFVPPNVLTPPQRSVTTKEFRWCLNHPDGIGNMRFVFGLYDLGSTEVSKVIAKNYGGFGQRIFNRLTAMLPYRS